MRAAADEADKADKAGSEGVPEPSTNSQEKPLPKPTRARIRSAEYVSSSVNLQSCPPAIHPEIAVVGRSNVGKSSLINMLTGRRALALVSKTPGSFWAVYKAYDPDQSTPVLKTLPARKDKQFV